MRRSWLGTTAPSSPTVKRARARRTPWRSPSPSPLSSSLLSLLLFFLLSSLSPHASRLIAQGNRAPTTESEEAELDSKARLKASREAGIISRSINTIFETLAKGTDEYAVKVSHLEICTLPPSSPPPHPPDNEELYDLLDPENKGLKIFEDPGNPQGAIQVKGLTEVRLLSSSLPLPLFPPPR